MTVYELTIISCLHWCLVECRAYISSWFDLASGTAAACRNSVKLMHFSNGETGEFYVGRMNAARVCSISSRQKQVSI